MVRCVLPGCVRRASFGRNPARARASNQANTGLSGDFSFTRTHPPIMKFSRFFLNRLQNQPTAHDTVVALASL